MDSRPEQVHSPRTESYREFAVGVFAEAGIDLEKLPPKERNLYNLTVTSIAEGLTRIQEKFEDQSPESHENLRYHNTEHTKKVVRRTVQMLTALQTKNKTITPTTILIGAMEAAWHDVVQDFREEDGKRRRAGLFNEEESAKELYGFLKTQQLEDLPPEAFKYLTEEQLTRDIVTTQPDLGEISQVALAFLRQREILPKQRSIQTVLQNKLTKESTLIAKVLALADLGTAGMESPEEMWEESWRVFFEEHLQHFIAANQDGFIDTEEDKRLRDLITGWIDSQSDFIRARYALFHTQAKELFSEKEFSALQELFPNFESRENIQKVLDHYNKKNDTIRKAHSLQEILPLIDPDGKSFESNPAAFAREVAEKRGHFLGHLSVLNRLLSENLPDHTFIAHASTALAVHLHQIKNIEGFANALIKEEETDAFQELVRIPTDFDFLTTDEGFESIVSFFSNEGAVTTVGGTTLSVTKISPIQETYGQRKVNIFLQVTPGGEEIELDIWTGITKNDRGTLQWQQDQTEENPSPPVPISNEQLSTPSTDSRRKANISVLSRKEFQYIYTQIWYEEVRSRTKVQKRRIGRLKLMKQVEEWIEQGNPERIDDIRDQVGKTVAREKTSSLHQHLEGTLGPHHLMEIVDEIERDLGIKIKIPNTLWDQMFFLMAHRGEEKHDIHGFIEKLATRWMRLILVQGMLQGLDGHVILDYFFKKIVEISKDDNTEAIELLTSALALTMEGNLKTLEPNEKKFTPEENAICEEWVARRESINRDLKPTTRSYYQRFKEFAQKEKTVRMTTRLCIRREQDICYRNGQFRLQSKCAKDLLELFQEGAIVGIDIAGPELSVPLGEFSELFSFLRANRIPFTVHAGEIWGGTVDERNQAYQNLYDAIMGGARRLGHAVRLFDTDSQYAIDLLHYVLLQEPPIYFEMNFRSNLWTSVVDGAPSMHPLVRALRREHPLFKKGTRQGDELYNRFLERLTINHDDPHVVDTEADNKNLIREISEVLHALGDDSPWKDQVEIHAFVKMLSKNAQNALLNKKQHSNASLYDALLTMYLHRKLVHGPEEKGSFIQRLLRRS